MAEYFGSSLALLDLLGSGGMAEIYRARLEGTGGFEKIVAVKRILPHLAKQEGIKARFEREISLASKLQHPNVVQVFQSGELDDYLYVVMEFVDGKNIAQLIKQTMARRIPVPIELVVHIVSEAARGLEYAHTLTNEEGKALQIIHRDVNPRNIMVGYKGAVKVVDFGIARAVDQTQLTLSQSFTGTARYASPEQVRGDELDARTDIFSLGIVLFELLTQQHLFPGESSFQIMNAVMNSEVPDIRAIRSDVPQELCDIFALSMARDRNDRYSSARAFYEDLARFRQKAYPEFLPEHLSDFMKNIFSDVIHSELIERRKSQALALSDSAINRARAEQGAATKISTKSQQKRRPAMLFAALFSILSLTALTVVGIALLSGGSRPPTVRVVSSGTTTASMPVPDVDQASVDEIQEIPNFLGWLAAEDLPEEAGPVRTWKGRGKASMIAVQADPLKAPNYTPKGLIGGPALIFDGQDDFFSLDALAGVLSQSDALSIFIRASVFSDRTQVFFSAQGPQREGDVFRVGTAERGVLRLKGTTAPLKYIDSRPGILKQQVPQVFSALTHGGKFQMREQGVAALNLLIGDVAYFANTRFISLGQEYDEKPSDFFHGEISDVILFSRMLSDEEALSVEKYLMDKQ